MCRLRRRLGWRLDPVLSQPLFCWFVFLAPWFVIGNMISRLQGRTTSKSADSSLVQPLVLSQKTNIFLKWCSPTSTNPRTLWRSTRRTRQSTTKGLKRTSKMNGHFSARMLRWSNCNVVELQSLVCWNNICAPYHVCAAGAGAASEGEGPGRCGTCKGAAGGWGPV